MNIDLKRSRTSSWYVTESAMLSAVIQAAKLYGWLVAHFRPALTKQGWRTAVSGDGAGWPDLVLLKDGRLIVAELKSEKGKLSKAQEIWLSAWGQIENAEVYVVRPADLDRFFDTLRKS